MSCGVHLLLKGYFWAPEEKAGLEKTDVGVDFRECLAYCLGSETAHKKKVRNKRGEAGRQTMRWGHKHFRGWEVSVKGGSSR